MAEREARSDDGEEQSEGEERNNDEGKPHIERLVSGDGPGDGSPPPNPFAGGVPGQGKRKSIVDQLKSAVGAGASKGVQIAEEEGMASHPEVPVASPYKRMSLFQIGKAIVTGEVESSPLESMESPWKPNMTSAEPIPKKLKNEDAKWADPNFDPAGKEGPEIRDFRKPEDWWLSAEQAVEVLEMERRGLKKDFAETNRPAAMLNSIMATNRLVTQGLKSMVERPDEQEKVKFRDGLEPIVHVLTPDVQRQMHAILCKAVRTGAIEEVDNLLRFQIDLDYSDAFGTPLHYAVQCDQVECAKALLDKGAYPGALNCRDQTALHLAVMIDVSAQVYPAGSMAVNIPVLELDIGCQSPHLVELLLRYGAPANAVEIGGTSAVHIAAQHGYVKVLERLIVGGADCNRPNRLGWTPLHLAAMGQHHDAMDKLCINGMANPNLASTRSSVLEVPIDSERSLMFRCVKGDTPGHLAARYGYFFCLKVCLDNGGKTDAVNDKGETLMHVAIGKADPKIIDLILEFGWDFLDMKDNAGRDPVDVCDACVVDHQEDAEIRSTLAGIKTTLAKMGIRKNQQKHKELIEQARKGIGGRRKQTTQKIQNEDATLNEAADQEIEDVEIDEKTLGEKMAAMTMELEAARAEARAAEQQSRLKTHSLNEVLQDYKRRLAEAEFMLERERASRFSLEQEILDMISIGATGGQSDYDDVSHLGGAAQEAEVMRVGTAGAGPVRGYTSTGIRRAVTFDGAATQ